MRRSYVLPIAKEGPRVNKGIRGLIRVQLIDESGRNLGVVLFSEALDRASRTGYDLVEIAPNAQPPVCKILDYGRYRYELQKSSAEAKKNQKTIEIKEIKIRPNIDDHDYDTKLKQAYRFFESGNKVKVTLRFRGREIEHPEIGIRLLKKMCEDLSDAGKLEVEPRLEGKMMVMLLLPK